MNDTLFKILEIVVTAVITIVARYLIPILMTELKNCKHEWVYSIVMIAVRAAEQIIQEKGAGEKKYELALRLIHDAGVKMTDEQLNSLIESAVQIMNAEMVFPHGEYDEDMTLEVGEHE